MDFIGMNVHLSVSEHLGYFEFPPLLLLLVKLPNLLLVIRYLVFGFFPHWRELGY
jgi:hypothetical protein